MPVALQFRTCLKNVIMYVWSCPRPTCMRIRGGHIFVWTRLPLLDPCLSFHWCAGPTRQGLLQPLTGRERERDWGREPVRRWAPTDELEPQCPACHGRALVPGDGFLLWKANRERRRPRAPPAMGNPSRGRAPPVAGSASHWRPPSAVSSASHGRPHRGRERAPPVAGSTIRARASLAAGSPSRVGHARDPPPPANGSRRRGARGGEQGQGGTRREGDDGGADRAPSLNRWSWFGRLVLERAWEERDGGRLKKPLTCGPHTSVRWERGGKKTKAE
jgi:hypothetical protein